LATLNESKREAIDLMARRASGAKCLGFEESNREETGFDFRGEFSFPTGNPGLFHFWRSAITGNMLFLEVK
jgi:hypothetical protein